ncbi:helix-turn-helix domain-containing protein [Amphibiibacter pelophylacis]|uniref:Helix-turn-helix domain-containing protein n=1 Tax=Amphibiibacter pelophylacis TaxID=1799477 RepID=A0ACC6P3N7_9BURK
MAQSVAQAVEQYFEDLDGEPPKDLYALFVDILEKPLLETVLVKARGNQCRAADWLGLNRNTLARKLQQHGMDARALWFEARLAQRRQGKS